MKRFLSFAMVMALLSSMFALHVNAAESADDLVSRTIEYLDNGDYIVTETYKPAIQPFSGTSGYKTATYTNSSGSRIFAVTVYGSFSYNGSSSSATSSSASVDIYASNTSFVSKNAYTSGSSAYGVGTAKYSGINCSVTAKLTCDKNGNLY